MTELRKKNVSNRKFEIDKISEAETRKTYIDLDLMEAGWQIGRDCLEEVEVKGMPNSTGLDMWTMYFTETMDFPLR